MFAAEDVKRVDAINTGKARLCCEQGPSNCGHELEVQAIGDRIPAKIMGQRQNQRAS